jgi:hypothetical protein
MNIGELREIKPASSAVVTGTTLEPDVIAITTQAATTNAKLGEIFDVIFANLDTIGEAILNEMRRIGDRNRRTIEQILLTTNKLNQDRSNQDV